MTQPGRPAVFVHGLWLQASSWGPWLELFQEVGYAPTAPGAPRPARGRPGRALDGNREVTRYLGTRGSARVARGVLVSPIPPFLLQTPDNPEGVPQGLFDGFVQVAMADAPAWMNGFLDNFYNFDTLRGTLVSDQAWQASWNLAVTASATVAVACIGKWATDFRADLPEIAGLVVDSADGTRVAGHIDLGPDHYTPWGVVHGGVYTTAAESAASLGASLAVRDRGQFAVGVHNATDFLRPATSGRAEVIAEPLPASAARRSQAASSGCRASRFPAPARRGASRPGAQHRPWPRRARSPPHRWCSSGPRSRPGPGQRASPGPGRPR